MFCKEMEVGTEAFCEADTKLVSPHSHFMMINSIIIIFIPANSYCIIFPKTFLSQNAYHMSQLSFSIMVLWS